jgi:uncharacterized alpha-E superfamily protein
MYRKRHGRIAPDKVVAFLLFDREFPRAILHCLHAANDSLRAIVGPAGGTSAAGLAAAESGAGASSAGMVMSMASPSSSMSMSGAGSLASGSMAAIPLAPMQAAPGALATLAELRMEALLRELEAHAAQSKDLLAGRLHQLLDGTQVRLNELGEAIRDSFFAPY